MDWDTYKRRRKRYKAKRAQHWARMLRFQVLAYLVVLVLWAVPIPNPVKLLAVSFHEISHGLAAVATGGRVFGYAIAPGGSGVTFGIGGHLPTIVAAGYVGGAVFGAMLYGMSVKMQPRHGLFALLLFVLGTGAFGWLNDYTFVFGIGAMGLILILFATPPAFTRFFLQLVGSACCLYAPLEVTSDLLGLSWTPSVKGADTVSDISQLSALTGVPAVLIGIVIIAFQITLLVFLVRWTCDTGAKTAIRQEADDMRRAREIIKEVRSMNRQQAYDIGPKR